MLTKESKKKHNSIHKCKVCCLNIEGINKKKHILVTIQKFKVCFSVLKSKNSTQLTDLRTALNGDCKPPELVAIRGRFIVADAVEMKRLTNWQMNLEVYLNLLKTIFDWAKIFVTKEHASLTLLKTTYDLAKRFITST